MRNDLYAEASYNKWLPNSGVLFLIGVEKSLRYRRNKRQPPEAAVLQEKQAPVEVRWRREKSQNSDKQGFGRQAEDPYNRARRVRAKSPQEERQEAAKHCHESAVEANTQMSPIGKGSNHLLAGTAVRKVTVREHLVLVYEWQGIRPAASCLPTSQHNCHL